MSAAAAQVATSSRLVQVGEHPPQVRQARDELVLVCGPDHVAGRFVLAAAFSRGR